MSAQKVDDEITSPSHLEEVDSPRKRPRLDTSSRKSWSLMDRRTDQEVLQEMGVSLLEPDDNEIPCEATPSSSHQHKTLKRKRDIENVNPNVLTMASPRKFSPKSPRVKVCSPSPGPSKVNPRSVEKARPLQPSDAQILETTIIDEYLIDEETPLAQVTGVPQGFNCVERKQNSYTPLGQEEELILSRRTKSEPSGADSFNILSDEMILSVFRWLPKLTLAHCMVVCKRLYLEPVKLGLNLLLFQIGEWHPTTPPSQSRIQYLDLSISTIDIITLNCLLQRCSGLKKLSLESVQLDDRTCELIGKCNNLETLNLTMAQGITDKGLTSILEGCTSLASLNISWCNLTEEALNVLVTMLPQKLQRLNVGGARIMTNEMVIKLVERCPRLLELDLSDCSRVSGSGVQAVQALTRLEHLALSRCYLLPPHVLTKLNCMVSLQYLEVWGMLHATSLAALRAALPAIQLNQFMFSAIARPTVGTRRTSIWGLRTRD
ncbi:hypothetical protein ABMA28_012715 [Loxostege sticticalis]|uniref:F-box/LRR-repeat protein 15-like leucin rich repeat domain-containing protein n=1 Tax=Loxostege sticticalis TaxID=481309 RepID=A0ABD0S5B8_LOXSC